MTPKAGLIVGGSIDGEKSAEAETEMREKLNFKMKPENTWEIRHFLAVMPEGKTAGDVVEELQTESQNRAQEEALVEVQLASDQLMAATLRLKRIPHMAVCGWFRSFYQSAPKEG